mmetsp:Transcript_85658/g.183604  ORF Transcript_85658/g.183604 Transcript_85658/m.183604 type:complete len:242 (-) Transcript_85658:69-794(-)
MPDGHCCAPHCCDQPIITCGGLVDAPADASAVTTGAGTPGVAGKKLRRKCSDFTAHFMAAPRSFCDRSHKAAFCAASSVSKATKAVRFTSGFTEVSASPSGDDAKSSWSSSVRAACEISFGRSWRMRVFLLALITGRTRSWPSSTESFSDCCAAVMSVATSTSGPSSAMSRWPPKMQSGMNIWAFMCCWMKTSSDTFSFESSSSKTPWILSRRAFLSLGSLGFSISTLSAIAHAHPQQRGR